VAEEFKSVPPVVVARFGHPRAKPRVVSVYNPAQGWNDDCKRRVVTVELVEELRQQGITLIEAKWRRNVKQLNLFLIPAAEGQLLRRGGMKTV
jgi:hypothetical protein